MFSKYRGDHESENQPFLSSGNTPDPTDWNYKLNGADWGTLTMPNFKNCKSNMIVQSPIDLNSKMNNVTGTPCKAPHQCYYDWDMYEFSFLAMYASFTIDTKKTGLKDFVYHLYPENVSNTTFNGFWGSEPLKTEDGQR